MRVWNDITAAKHVKFVMKTGLKYIPRDYVRYVYCILQITIVMEWFPPLPKPFIADTRKNK